MLSSQQAALTVSSGNTIYFGPIDNNDFYLRRSTPSSGVASNGGNIHIQGGSAVGGLTVDGSVYLGSTTGSTPNVIATSSQFTVNASSSVQIAAPAITIGTVTSVLTLHGTVRIWSNTSSLSYMFLPLA